MAAGKIFAISFAINAIMGGGFSAVIGQSSNAMRQLKERTNQLNAEQKRLNNIFAQSENEGRKYQNTVLSLKGQLDAGKISQSQYEMAVKRAAETMRSSSMSIDEYKSHMARLRQEADRTQAKLAQFQRATAARNQAAANFSAARMGMYETAATIGLFAAPLVSMVETSAQFEASMSKVQAITRASGEDIQRLTDNARKLGETTQFSATQAAEAMSYLGMAGWNTEQIMAGMPGLLALAAAGGTDLARTADIVSDDLTAFGLSAEQASHMADVFAVTATRCNTNVEMIGETMKYAAPVARGYGATMEETAALTGLMANAGVKASQAGTSLRAGFLRLAGPPKKASKALDELGISLSDATKEQQEAQNALKELGIDMDNYSGGPAHKMVAIISDLRDATAQMGKEQKLAALSAIFGTNAATGWLNVLEAGPEVFESLVNEMENCDGEAEKMAGVMMNNAKGAFIQLKSAMESVAISVGTIFLPTLTSIARGAATTAGSISRFVQEHQGLTAAIVGSAVAIGSLVGFISFYKFVSTGIAFAKMSVDLYTLSIRNMGVASTAAATEQNALSLATTMQARASAMASAAHTKAMAVFNTVTSGDTYRRIGQSAMDTYSQLRAITWAQIGQSIKSGVTGGITSTQAAFNGLKTSAAATMSQTRQTVVSAASSIATQAGNAGRSVVGMVRNFSMAGALQTAANGFKALGTAIMGIGRASLATMFSPLGIAIMAIAGAAYLIYSNWEMVGPFFMGLWAQIQAAFSNAWNMMQPAIAQLQAAFSVMISSVGPAFGRIGATVMGAFNQIAAAFSENSGALSMLGDALLFIAEILGGVLVTAFVVSSNIAVGCLTGLINVAAAVISGIIGFLTGVIQFITGVFTGNWTMAWEGITNIFSNAFNTLKNIASSVLGGIETMLNGIVSSIKGVASLLPGIGGGGGDEISSNARGGIYRKGAFLTTFAEDGPEAAIPLDGSPRAIGLWRKAGEILGIGGGANTSNGSPAETLRLGSFAPHPAQYVEQPAAMNAPPISITLHFNGDHEPNEIRKAVERAGQTVQRTFMEQMEQYNRERGRLAYEQ